MGRRFCHDALIHMGMNIPLCCTWVSSNLIKAWKMNWRWNWNYHQSTASIRNEFFLKNTLSKEKENFSTWKSSSFTKIKEHTLSIWHYVDKILWEWINISWHLNVDASNSFNSFEIWTYSLMQHWITKCKKMLKIHDKKRRYARIKIMKPWRKSLWNA